MNKQCVCTCSHLQVQGKYTKASATYTSELAHAIALDLLEFIRAERQALLSEDVPSSKGLESIFVNDVACSAERQVCQPYQHTRRSFTPQACSEASQAQASD